MFFLSSFFFRRASSLLREPLTLDYIRNRSILYGAVQNPIAFSQLRSFARHLQPLIHKLWLPVWDAIFVVICMHAHLKIMHALELYHRVGRL